MEQQPEPLATTQSDAEAVILDADDIQALANLLNALMEADFSLQKEKVVAIND